MNAETQAAAGFAARLTAIPGELAVRLALRLDAAVTGANGVAYLALADVLDGPLGISAGVMRPVGAFLVAFAVAVYAVSTTEVVTRAAVRAVIAANAIWAADSLIVLGAGWTSPTTMGAIWIGLQALVVAGFAALQAAALSRREARSRRR
jgi:hypothetical protein